MKMSGMSQMLNHREASHAQDSFARLNKLRREGILCDLTILVQGHKFKAHKTVMAACSDYFLNAVCGGKSTASVTVSPAGHMTIEMQYVTMRGFAPLLEYAYSSELRANASDVIDVLSAASYMQMFNVANACSEFMRSNLLWTQGQSRLAALPMLAGRNMLLNGQIHGEHPAAAPNPVSRPNGLPEAMSSLLASSAMSGAAINGRNGLSQPPMLIPISSMTPYEVGLHWADTMAGTHNLLSRFVNNQPVTATQSPPSSISPSSHNSPAAGYDVVTSSAGPRGTEEGTTSLAEAAEKAEEPNLESNYNNNNNNSNNNSEVLLPDKPSTGNNRKSIAVKLEANLDDSANNGAEDGTSSVTTPPPDAEDSWQSLQRLYSFHCKPDSKVESDGDTNETRKNAINEIRNKALGELRSSSLSPSVISSISSAASIKSALDSIPRLDNAVSMVPRLTGLTVQNAILQRQKQIMEQQQQQREGEKLVAELPVVPPSGQYMSVRRRTLQSNVPKPHQCQICGSRFTRFHNLKQHIKLHSGIKPYECDECGKRFTRNYTLRLHKMKHVGIRNFRCGTCDASFTSLGEFRAHLRITMHSHMPINGLNGNSPSLMEPEDLSSAPAPQGVSKFNHFDAAMLRYGVGSPGSSGGGAAGEGSTGTISPLGHGAMIPGTGESPERSDRSMSGSPEDLSTKRPLSDIEDKHHESVETIADYSDHDSTTQETNLDSPKRRKISGIPLYQESSQTENDEDEPMSLVIDTSRD
ncbi:uncharacterized protein zf(c2h2)-65 [Ciona intestinalis]